MATVKFDEDKIDQLKSIDPDSLGTILNEMEREISDGNVVGLFYNPETTSEQLAREPLRTIADFHKYKRGVIEQPLEQFEKAVKGWRIYTFERVKYPSLEYKVSFNDAGEKTTFIMRKDEEDMWKIAAQTLPPDVLGAELELNDAIEENESGE